MHEYLDMKDVMREVLSPHLPNSFFAWLPFSIIPRPIFALDLGSAQMSTLSLSLHCSVIFMIIWKTSYYIFIYRLFLPVECQLHEVRESVSLMPGTLPGTQQPLKKYFPNG